MKFIFGIFGVIAWLFAGLIFLMTIAGKGTDIQLILAAQFGIFGAICLAAMSVLNSLEALKPGKPPEGAAAELDRLGA